MVGDQLHQILVRGDDGHLGARLDRGGGIGGHQVVGLVIVALDAADIERVGRLAHQLELGNEIVGRRGALRLLYSG